MEDLKKELQPLFDEFKSGLPKGITGEELEKKFNDFESKLGEKFEEKDYSSELTELKSAMEKLEQNVSKINAPVENPKELKSIEDALLAMWEKKGITTVEQLKQDPDYIRGIEFKAEVPTETSAQTGTIGRTLMDTMPKFPRLRSLAFLPYMRKSYLGSGKSRFGWNVGAYTSNIGYVGENATIGTNDAATSVEKTRGLAKVSAIRILTAEVQEDLPELARQMAMRMQEEALLWIDGQIYSGDGNPATDANPTHFYGLTNHATTFDATDFAATIATGTGNASDLIDAIKTKAKKVNHTIDLVWMNPTDVYKLRRTKDTTGQYVINQLITGELVMAGVRVIETEAVTADTLLAADSSVLQLKSKRELEFKVGQFGDDVKYDRYSAVLFARMQVLVEDEDQKALYKVASISADVAELEVPAA